MTPQAVNDWRLVPRLLVAGYSVFVWKVGIWFMSLPTPTVEQAGFASMVIGAAAGVFKFYTHSGGPVVGTE